MPYQAIVDTVTQIFAEKGEPTPTLSTTSPITGIGLDSLDIAALVSRLEERLGIDPFAHESLTEYPQTLGELAALYERSL